MTPKKLEICQEDKLLLLCARTRMNDEIKSQIIYLIKQDIDWDYLLQKSYEHRLTPLLYWQINNICPDYIPKNMMERLKIYFHENARKNLLYMGELLKILDLFEAEEIYAIPYKGPILAILIYGNLAFREFVDLDIFINHSDAIKSKEILVSEGYNPYVNLDTLKEKKFVETQYDYGLTNHEKSITIELHWRFTSLFFTLPKNTEQLADLNNLIYITLNGHRIRSLYPEDMIIILCIHNSGHRWSQLAWICDIAEFIQLNIDMNWELVIENARKIGAFKILLINLNLAKNLLGLKLPNEVSCHINNNLDVINISKRIQSNIFHEKCDKTSLLEQISLNLKIRDKTFWGIKDIINSAVKPTTYEWKNIPLPILLYPFYYLLRPFMLIIRYNI